MDAIVGVEVRSNRKHTYNPNRIITQLEESCRENAGDSGRKACTTALPIATSCIAYLGQQLRFPPCSNLFRPLRHPSIRHLWALVVALLRLVCRCQMPSTGSMLTLSGLNAYGAATHCAALLAASKAVTQTTSPPSQPQAADAASVAMPNTPHQQLVRERVSAEASLSLPSEVLPASVAGAADGHPAPCRRRSCQTGYMPQSAGDADVWGREMVVSNRYGHHRRNGGNRASAAAHGSSYLSWGHGGPSLPALSRSREVDTFSRALGTSPRLELTGGARDCLEYDDDLLSPHPHRPFAPFSREGDDSLCLTGGRRRSSGSSSIERVARTLTTWSRAAAGGQELVAGKVQRAVTSPGCNRTSGGNLRSGTRVR